MENEGIKEIDLQINELKKKCPEIYAWITLKEKQKKLKAMLDSNNSIENCEENRKELTDTEDEMLCMKKKYSSLILYDSLISVKKKIIEKSEEY